MVANIQTTQRGVNSDHLETDVKGLSLTRVPQKIVSSGSQVYVKLSCKQLGRVNSEIKKGQKKLVRNVRLSGNRFQILFRSGL